VHYCILRAAMADEMQPLTVSSSAGSGFPGSSYEAEALDKLHQRLEKTPWNRMLKFMEPQVLYDSFKGMYQNSAVVNALCLMLSISPPVKMDDRSMWIGTEYEDTIEQKVAILRLLVSSMALLGLFHGIVMGLALGGIPHQHSPLYMRTAGRFAGRFFPQLGSVLMPALLSTFLCLRSSVITPVAVKGEMGLVAIFALISVFLFYFNFVAHQAYFRVFHKIEEDTTKARNSDLADAMRVHAGEAFTHKYVEVFLAQNVARAHLKQMTFVHLQALGVTVGDAMNFLSSTTVTDI